MSEIKLISIVVPMYNEEKNIPIFYGELMKVIKNIPYSYELILVNDGSKDGSIGELKKLSQADSNVKVIDFTRNFGKEMATTAGINNSRGDACITVDADLQHPLEKIPEFIEKWEKGADVVVGIREKNQGEGLIKKIGSYFYYKIINQISDMGVTPNATDFRLIDQVVISEYNRLTEKRRMTRALIDWLGFNRQYIYFKAKPRIHGEAGYSFIKLLQLAFNSMISLSLFPLRIAGYLGIIITLISGALGIFIVITKYITQTYAFSWPAILAIINLFLIGIVLVCLGLISLYIASIHDEVTNRPLYIIRKSRNDKV
jgi:polyisoprenyl-phosphate glycosyltransferase